MNRHREKEKAKKTTAKSGNQCCRVDALVSIDGRGQIVLPKDLREKAKVGAGDKFAVISCEKKGEICCIALIKAEEFSENIKGMLGPMMGELIE
jgi:bifunctional DNA-binding transcriptional regulator/antitoxin component of YhaV-PrlF toxin-antitoxin module